jgi:NB-ARC domain
VKDGFDRSLWLNFRKVPTFNEFARWVLQEIGFLIDDPRVTNEALITELIYRLTEKRCLLVLDQLEAVQESPDLESFGEFLQTWRQRGHKSIVVITTRSSSIVATEAIYRLDLAGFTEAEGADFLRRQGVGAEDAGAMETLVQVAEGHPFLLGLAVSWLRQEAGGKIDRVWIFLRGCFRNIGGMRRRRWRRFSAGCLRICRSGCSGCC